MRPFNIAIAVALTSGSAGAQPPAPAPVTAAPGLALQAVPRACQHAGPGEDIVVCGRPDSDERHRLPLVRDRRFDPGGTVDSVSRERNRLLGGSSALLGSCNNIGPAGMTGCLGQGVWARREQRGR